MTPRMIRPCFFSGALRGICLAAALLCGVLTSPVGAETLSRYLEMRDGIRLAVDVHLPDSRPVEARLPTILKQTRYHRSRSGGLAAVRRLFLGNGYAWVDVDVRGSGASFGSRAHPWTAEEIADGAEIVDWIIAQDWSNGRVGAMGGSYDGTCAEFLLVNRHSAVKAVAPLFALYDVYADISRPGGVHLSWFTRAWGQINAALDENRVPPGVRPVEEDSAGLILAQAVQGHAANYDPHKLALAVVHRDDDGGDGIRMDSFSPHQRRADLDASGAAVYSYSGWFDGAYAHSAIKRHLTLSNPHNRLILGPWDHGGRHHIDLSDPGPNRFDHGAELLEFFDFHLKMQDRGWSRRKPVRYYTLVEGRWKESDLWPPPSRPQRLYFQEQKGLSAALPSGEGRDVYTIRQDAGTGALSRWDGLTGGLASPRLYPDRKARDSLLLVYESEPLDRDLEVTGHPLLSLRLSADAPDGTVFAYLEEVTPQGQVRPVTEGVLRLIHRRAYMGRPPYRSPSRYRSYLRSDAQPMPVGRPEPVLVDLLPVSYLVRRGHRIRLALAGADVDHFASLPNPPSALTVHRGGESYLELPVVDH